jgi:hypothetical protein
MAKLPNQLRQLQGLTLREKHFDKGAGPVKMAFFFSWTRPASFWDLAVKHLPLAFVAGIILLLPTCVPYHLLPLKSCTFLSLTGYPCIFCGFTRSFWAIANGNWSLAVHDCPLVCLLYITVVIMFLWNVLALILVVNIARGKFLQIKPGQLRWIVGVVIWLFISNWIYRLTLGLS